MLARILKANSPISLSWINCKQKYQYRKLVIFTDLCMQKRASGQKGILLPYCRGWHSQPACSRYQAQYDYAMHRNALTLLGNKYLSLSLESERLLVMSVDLNQNPMESYFVLILTYGPGRFGWMADLPAKESW